MESAPSSSTSTSHDHDHHLHHHHHQQPRRLIPPAQPVVDRIIRAIRHPLLLLHRSESNFFVLGATGNVYTVTLSATPTCTCPDRTTPCKHILFILIRVLGVSLDDYCLKRRTLRPCKLNRLLNTPIRPESLAEASLRERFHQLFFQSPPPTRRAPINNNIIEAVEEGTSCPICLEEIIVSSEKVVVACGTCRNLVHEECLLRWKRSRGRRGTICVICRARWRHEEHKYLNLAAYITTTTTTSTSSDEEEIINGDHRQDSDHGVGFGAAAATASNDDNNHADNDSLCNNYDNT